MTCLAKKVLGVLLLAALLVFLAGIDTWTYLLMGI